MKTYSVTVEIGGKEFICEVPAGGMESAREVVRDLFEGYPKQYIEAVTMKPQRVHINSVCWVDK